MAGGDRYISALMPTPARRAALPVLACCVIFVSVAGAIVLRLSAVQQLDSSIDGAVQRAVGQHQLALRLVAGFGERPGAGTLILVLVVLCLAARRLNGVLLVVIAIPVAPGVTEYGLKPLFARAEPYGAFPSGHTTAAFAIATVVGILLAMPGKRLTDAMRLAITLSALLAATAVSLAVLGLAMHTFTDALGGAAVGTGVALSVALLLDLPVVRQLLTRDARQHSEVPCGSVAALKATAARPGDESAADLPVGRTETG